jgi:hypothetical protein
MRLFNIIILFCYSLFIRNITVNAQPVEININSIPRSGTVLMYTHQDDDLIWMLPFWNISEKFIGAAMPTTTRFREIVHNQQVYMDQHGYNIPYESNWYNPWGEVTNTEYQSYYWGGGNPAYSYMDNEYLLTSWQSSQTELIRTQINRIKAKIEQYVADPSTTRIITHNNWGEYGHNHHKAVNIAVRELAVKYRKDVWISNNDGNFYDKYSVPSGMTYTMGLFDGTLFNAVRNIYIYPNNWWTWLTDYTPAGSFKFIKLVESGNDLSNLLTGESVTTSGQYQDEPGAYIFDGSDDYLTLAGNNYSSFTIAMRVKPDQISSMDISRMAEYPNNTATYDRSIFLNSNGTVSAYIYDGSTKIVSSNASLSAGEWAHIAITGNGSSLKLYINGALENTISAGNAITSYATPEFVLGQPMRTSSFFKGQLNDVRMLNYAMTESEISELSGMGYKITSSAGAGGTINPSGETRVNRGGSQSFSITANTGYQISDVRVDNNSVGAVSTYTFQNVSANHTISATFSVLNYTIISAAGTGGSISPAGTETVNYGSGKTYTISANTGYKISNVLVDNVSIGAVSTYTFENITANHTISAVFETTPTFTITTSSGTGGSISPGGTVIVNQGSNKTFTIAANVGYMIVDVSVDNASVGAVTTYSFNNITANHTISATFTPIPTYILTASSGSGGSISPNGEVTVSQGSGQTFTITANTGYQITDVKVDNISQGAIASYTFSNVTSAHSISATFSILSYAITSSAGPGGSISPAGTTTVNHGSGQTYTITANTGYQIADVKVDNVSQGAISSYTFSNVTVGHSISATFGILTYVITGSAGPGGSINPAGTTTVNYGSGQTYTITANTGYQIIDVKVDNVSQGAVSSYTFNNVTAGHSVSATFGILTYNITSSAGLNGTINPSGSATVNYGSDKTYTITPNTGYQISDVTVDNISQGAISSYTFSNINANHTINATFKVAIYTITSSAGSGGSISPSGASAFSYGANQTYTITVNTDYQIADVKVDNVSQGALLTYTFSNISANHSISVSFKAITYEITSTAGSGGSISPSGATAVNYGASQTYIITPNTGYQIVDVLVDNVSQGVISSYIFNNVLTAHTISATFAILTYTIQSSAGSGGTINPAGSTVVNHGSNKTYTITANAGYQVFDVKVDDISQGAITSYTFNNITKGHTITATFTTAVYTITSNAGTGGNISPAGSKLIAYGTSQTYVISSLAGYQISDVKVNNISVGSINSYTFSNVTANHTISVTFSPITYQIISVAGANGSIHPNGTATVSYGSEKTYTITPGDGYQVADVKVDDISVGAVSSYAFSNILANHTISVTFSRITYEITATSGAGGMIDPSGTIKADKGENVTYTFTPDYGYLISEVFIDGISIGHVNSYTFFHISANHSVSAIFKPITYSIISTADSGGIISPPGINNFDHGSDVSYDIIPDDGFQIADVLVDSISQGPMNNFLFENIKSNHVITARFRTSNMYTITSTVSERGGTISPAGVLNLREGSRQEYAIRAFEGYRINDVVVDDSSVGAVSSFVFQNLKADHTLSATFASDILVELFPNPFRENLNILIKSNLKDWFKISINDYSDRVLFTIDNVQGGIVKPVQIDLKPGVYFLKVFHKGNIAFVHQIVKY